MDANLALRTIRSASYRLVKEAEKLNKENIALVAENKRLKKALAAAIKGGN